MPVPRNANTLAPDPVISIVIPTRNRAAKLRRVIDQLLSDPYPHKEIIVCDDGSTDGTADVLRAYGSKVRWISGPGSGEYLARNEGLRMVTGDIIKYMSDDDFIQPGSLEFGAQYLISHPEVDILFNQALWYYEQDDGSMVLIDAGRRTSESVTFSNFLCPRKPPVASESAFFRRSVIERIGYFDAHFLFADGEYWARASRLGLGIAISDFVVIHHQRSRDSGVERKLLPAVREKWRMARKHGAGILQLFVLSWWIPWMHVRSLHRCLPPSVALAVRKFVWRIRTRQSSGSLSA